MDASHLSNTTALLQNGSTAEVSDNESENWIASKTEVIIEVTVLVILCIIGTAGNIVTIIATLKSPRLRSPLHVQLGYMMSCDLIMCCVAIPFTVYGTIAEGWQLSDVFCHYLGTLAILIYSTTVYVTTLVAFDRTINCFPGHRIYKILSTRKVTIIILIFIWIITLVQYYPLLINQYKVEFLMPYGFCLVSPNNLNSGIYLFVKMMGVTIGYIPVTLTALLYVSIYIRLWTQKVTFDRASARKRFMKVTQTMLFLFIWLCICLLPEAIHNSLDYYLRAPVWVTRVCFYALLMHPAFNPVIYLIRMREYRNTILRMCKIKQNRVQPAPPVRTGQNSSSLPIFQVTSFQ